MADTFTPNMIGAPVLVRTSTGTTVGILESYGDFKSGKDHIEQQWWRYQGDPDVGTANVGAVVIQQVGQTTTDYLAEKLDEFVRSLEATLWNATIEAQRRIA